MKKIKYIKTFESFNLNESVVKDGYQSWAENFYIKNLIKFLLKAEIIYKYIENGEESRFSIPLDDNQKNHPFLKMADDISKLINLPNDKVVDGLKKVGTIRKRDKEIMNSPIIYSGKMGLENVYEVLNDLVFKELSNGIDSEKAKEIVSKYKGGFSDVKPSDIFSIK